MVESSDEIERGNGPAGASEEDHVAAGPQNVEALLKRSLADAVVNHVDAFIIGETLGFGFEIGVGIEDDFVGSGFAGQFGFFLG